MGLDACGDEYWEARKNEQEMMDIGCLVSCLLRKPLQEDGVPLEEAFLKMKKYEQKMKMEYPTFFRTMELFAKEKGLLLPFLETHLHQKFEKLLNELLAMKIWNEDFRKRYKAWEKVLRSADLTEKDIGITKIEIDKASVHYRIMYGSVRIHDLGNFVASHGVVPGRSLLELQPEGLYELCFSRTPKIDFKSFGTDEKRFEALARGYYKILRERIESICRASNAKDKEINEALYTVIRLDTEKEHLKYAPQFSAKTLREWEEVLRQKRD